MRRWFVCLAVGLIFVGSDRAADEKWQTFPSKEGRFSVSLPGKPKEETKQVPTPGGRKKDLHIFVLAVAADQVYLINYSDYAWEEVKEAKTKEAAFDAIRNGNVKAFKGKLVSEKKITAGKGKHPGRELLIELPQKKDFYRSRIFFVGKRLYQVVALGSDEFARGKLADQFFDSFKVEE